MCALLLRMDEPWRGPAEFFCDRPLRDKASAIPSVKTYAWDDLDYEEQPYLDLLFCQI